MTQPTRIYTVVLQSGGSSFRVQTLACRENFNLKTAKFHFALTSGY